MIRMFVCLILFPFFAFSDPSQLFSENEDPVIFHHVNVITGNLNITFQDALIEGAHPLLISRTYSSAGALERNSTNFDLILKSIREGWMVQGGWNLISHTNLLIESHPDRKQFKVYMSEPNGNMISYVYSHQKAGNKHVIFLKSTNSISQSSGKLSNRTNPQNNLLELDLKGGFATLFVSDGGTKTYRGRRLHRLDPNSLGKDYYLLEAERLPSRHQHLYFYDKKKHLQRIESTNPVGNKIYASLNIEYLAADKHKSFEIKCRTSDGKQIHYKTARNEGRDYINEMQTNYRPKELYHFAPGRKSIGARLSSVNLAGIEPFEVQYYLPANMDLERKWASHPGQKEFHIDKVEKIIAPVGPKNERIAVASFSYYSNRTDARDAEGLLTRYHHDSERLTLIEYFDEKNQLRSLQKFYWDGTKLRCKAMFNQNHQPQFAKTFAYDSGNVVEEVLWGYLTGNETAALEIDSRGHCKGGESYRKTYSYYSDSFNLLKTENEENGPTYEYFYKPGSDLCTAKLTKDEKGSILVREFSFYDDDNLLLCEILDDGKSLDVNDLQKITQRREKYYERNEASGLTESITESYWDISTLTKKFLKKIKYTYQNKKVHTEEVIDALGNSRYIITTEYDNFGSIKRKTTPLGLENTYFYNAQNCLEESKEVGSSKKIYFYDQANRLVCCKEPDTEKVVTTSYDSKNRILEQTDFRGNKTTHSYDFFGNRKTTELPECKNEREQKYRPILKFDHDLHGNLIFVEASNSENTQTSYNLFRNPILVIQADGTQIRHIYNKNGTLQKTTYPDGTEVHFNYDLFKRETAKIIYEKDGKQLFLEHWQYGTFELNSYTNPMGLKTQFIYDGAGRKIEETAEDRKVIFSYDSLGFLEKTDNGVSVFIQKHNVEGFVEEQWEEDSSGQVENWMKFFYDRENQKEKVIRKTSQGEAIDLFSHKDGKLISHTDPKGNITRFEWNQFFKNDLGQNVLQKTVIDPLGNKTIETHDAGERIVIREKRTPQDQTAFKEEFFYDASGNQIKRVSYIYAAGTQIKEISTAWKYDKMGRVKETTESGQKTTLCEYDLRGRLACKTLPNGVHLRYSYDGIDRLEELTSSDGKIHYQYFYETGSNPVRILDLIQYIDLTRSYNKFGQTILETNSKGFLSKWKYDSIGRCIAFTLPDGSSIDYPAEGAHISAVRRKDPYGAILYEHRYREFDCNGHITNEDRIFDLGSILTTRDLLERPIKQTCFQINQSIAYGLSGLVSKTYNSFFGEKLYNYDSLNQLIEEGDQTYQFDSIGNPSRFEINDLNQVFATSTCSLTYDKNGNSLEKISSNAAIEYEFDPLGRLVGITNRQKKKVLYFYDPLSRLFAKETYSYAADSWNQKEKVYYLYDQEWEIGTQNEKGQILELKILGLGIQGDVGAAIALEIGNKIYAPLHDFNGNIIGIVDSKGSLIETYDINAFGNELSASNISPWRFSSKRSEEDLVFFGLRFYDPSLKRWLSPDPAGYVDGVNLYAFVQNSPLNRLDLFGLAAQDSFAPVTIHVPIPQVPRLPGFNSFLAKGSINGIEVDFVLCCGHWHQLQFTPQEMKAGQVDIMNHLHELTANQGTHFNLVTAGNGVYTSLEECSDMSSQIGKEVGNTLLMTLYNPTARKSWIKGVGLDLDRTRKEREKIETPIVCLMRQFMATTGEKLYSINPQSLWLCIPHSENGVIMKRAIEGMSESQQQIMQKLLYVYALGPAEPLAKFQGNSVINVYSRRDYITGFGIFGHARSYKKNPDYNIRKLRCISSSSDKNFWIADHGCLKPTYRKAWKGHISDLKQVFQFYEGSKND